MSGASEARPVQYGQPAQPTNPVRQIHNRNPPRSERRKTGGLLIYLILFLSLQVFLMVVGLEGVLAHEPGLARAAAIMSVCLFGFALALRWFLGHD